MNPLDVPPCFANLDPTNQANSYRFARLAYCEPTTEGAFGLEWRKHTPNNASLNYRFDAKGTGASGSEKDLQIEWFMNREFRLALLHDWTRHDPTVAIDFTRYELKAEEPQGLQREWSLMNVLNQKGTRPQDKPIRLGQLTPKTSIAFMMRYPQLKNRA